MTIVFTAVYDEKGDDIYIAGVSLLGEADPLTVQDYEAEMKWKQVEWEHTQKNINGQPYTITVCGIEGCWTENTTRQP